jgi:ribosomal protein S18 acetylase RimI-like enzyme
MLDAGRNAAGSTRPTASAPAPREAARRRADATPGASRIEVRRARPDEHAAVAEVTVAAYRAFYGDALGSYARALRDVRGRTRGAEVLVAVEDGAVVGAVTYVRDPRSPAAEALRPGEAGVRMLAVVPDRQRRGVGRELALACVERARAEGKRAVVLHADRTNRASRRLWRGLGFRRDPSRDFRPDAETHLDCYVLDLAGRSTPPGRAAGRGRAVLTGTSRRRTGGGPGGSRPRRRGDRGGTARRSSRRRPAR